MPIETKAFTFTVTRKRFQCAKGLHYNRHSTENLILKSIKTNNFAVWTITTPLVWNPWAFACSNFLRNGNFVRMPGTISSISHWAPAIQKNKEKNIQKLAIMDVHTVVCRPYVCGYIIHIMAFVFGYPGARNSRSKRGEENRRTWPTHFLVYVYLLAKNGDVFLSCGCIASSFVSGEQFPTQSRDRNELVSIPTSDQKKREGNELKMFQISRCIIGTYRWCTLCDIIRFLEEKQPYFDAFRFLSAKGMKAFCFFGFCRCLDWHSLTSGG